VDPIAGTLASLNWYYIVVTIKHHVQVEQGEGGAERGRIWTAAAWAAAATTA
jgi:hypothetical protein